MSTFWAVVVILTVVLSAFYAIVGEDYARAAWLIGMAIFVRLGLDDDA